MSGVTQMNQGTVTIDLFVYDQMQRAISVSKQMLENSIKAANADKTLKIKELESQLDAKHAELVEALKLPIEINMEVKPEPLRVKKILLAIGEAKMKLVSNKKPGDKLKYKLVKQ